MTHRTGARAHVVASLSHTILAGGGLTSSAHLRHVALASEATTSEIVEAIDEALKIASETAHEFRMDIVHRLLKSIETDEDCPTCPKPEK